MTDNQPMTEVPFRLKRADLYACPQNLYEIDRERAIAWHLVDLVKRETGHDHLSFSAALALVKTRDQAMAMLHAASPETSDLVEQLQARLAAYENTMRAATVTPTTGTGRACPVIGV